MPSSRIPINLNRANCYGFAFGGPNYWGSINAIDVQHITETEFVDVTGSVIQAHDRIVYLNPAEKPHVFTITHAQIVVAVPPNVTDINDPRVIVDSRRGQMRS